MNRAYFVSDIHIKASQDPNGEAFVRFLERCHALEIDHLFLVGDIFDLWIADRDHFIQIYARIIEKLKSLKDRGIEIHYFEGNHDLDLKLFWQDQLGFQVYDRAAYFTIGSFRVRVEHGDQMDPEDRGYLFLRWFLRTPVLRWLGRHLPNAWVKWIGERSSRASREYTSTIKSASDDQVRAKIEAHVRRVYSEAPFDLIVSGHVHVADDRRIEFEDKKVRSINLGTWLREPMVLSIVDDQIEFKNCLTSLPLIPNR